MKTLYKSATILALLGGLALAAQAQTVIGSWQNNTGDGWIDNGNGQPITNSANTNKYQFVSGAVAGYAQSLEINQGGFNQNLEIDLNSLPGDKAAFAANHLLSFTVSFPASGGVYTAGYSQIYNFTLNCSGLYTNIPWAAWTGNSGNMPNVGYYSSFPGQSITVTWDYSSILTNPAVAIALTNNGYLQLSFTSNNGGGAPTNIYMNNVVLSGYVTPTIIIDQFNGTNAYAGTNDYNVDDNITNIYNLWTGYGGNYVVNPDDGGLTWDPTQDANGNANSGSLKITANWTNGAGQYLVWDRGPNNTFALNPPITNGYGLLTFEFDLKYDPSSPTVVNGTVTNYGHMEIGPVPPYSPMTFGTFDYDVTNTGWVHVTLPVNATLDPADLLSINGIYFKQFGGYYGGLNGQTVLWIDNIKFTYTNLPPVIPPPTVTITKAIPALRIFAGDSSDIYHREELATTDQDKSWVGAARPSQYSFTLLSYPANINQTHIMLLPMNFLASGQTAYGYNGVDFNYASNLVWLVLNPGPSAGSVVGRIQWKTNAAAANPGHTDLTFTNPTAVGTWTLEFDSDSGGQVLAPGGNSYPFTLSDPNVTADFGGPLVAYFGLQPNGTAGEGQYEDWARISITNVAGSSVYEDFTTESSRSTTGPWTPLQTSPSLIVASTNDFPAYWMGWTLPAVNFDIGSKTNLTTPGSWISPQYYGGYFDNTAPYGKASQLGTRMWELLPKDDLPTVDGTQNGVLAPRAFFLVSTNVVFP